MMNNNKSIDTDQIFDELIGTATNILCADPYRTKYDAEELKLYFDSLLDVFKLKIDLKYLEVKKEEIKSINSSRGFSSIVKKILLLGSNNKINRLKKNIRKEETKANTNKNSIWYLDEMNLNPKQPEIFDKRLSSYLSHLGSCKNYLLELKVDMQKGKINLIEIEKIMLEQLIILKEILDIKLKKVDFESDRKRLDEIIINLENIQSKYDYLLAMQNDSSRLAFAPEQTPEKSFRNPNYDQTQKNKHHWCWRRWPCGSH
jgi:hypothetical protein